MDKNNGNDIVGDTVVVGYRYGNVQQYFYCFRFYIDKYFYRVQSKPLLLDRI